ncbi:hypothetical protein [Granulicella sp. S156]|uniref:hypothetical protein n=1 Tax=Granulicella sp. S156 TaxID=1747224 RepID=UPI00131E251B|nr:hypothetical protein [Granulicella sp. S156]
MLTLLLTVLATAYFVVPLLLCRTVVGCFLIRRSMAASKSEELMRGALWSIIPLVIAWSTRNLLLFRFPADAKAKAEIVFTALYSDKLFDELHLVFFPSFIGFVHANLSLLARIYLVVLIASVILGLIARNFGVVRAQFRRHGRLTKWMHLLVLPLISEWHIALSPMLLHDRDQYGIEVDVMMKGGVLYRGRVSEKKIGSDGSLQTLLLDKPDRFRHNDFVRDCSAYEAQDDKSVVAKPISSEYWRPIPGDLFLLVGSEISSVNVRHTLRTLISVNPLEDKNLTKLISELSRIVNVALPDALDRSNRQSS